ncbi:hypothetical protein LEP1GSC072_0201 [Leptospira noguchii str. Bonito]|nr:hypothetical protein LEP1GSC072_0201 [Leptospira noguchii str. Bonito]
MFFFYIKISQTFPPELGLMGSNSLSCHPKRGKAKAERSLWIALNSAERSLWIAF